MPHSSFRYLSPAFLLLASVALTGCGANSSPSALPGTAVSTLSGVAHGGPNPVVGATVQLYATTSGGYGATATLLGTAITGTKGGFSFIAPLACPAGQQAYVTAQGGNPGGGLNPNYLLMAALGPCSTLSSSTSIWIDEVTTVAAAETLRPFTSLSTVGILTTVNVGAPANNNAAFGTCTLSGTSTTGCVAAGLSHAFANAQNLASSVSVNGVAPTGQAYAVAPSNPSSAVPQALINTLANALQACVNSTGGSAGDNSACGILFGATTPPVTGGTAPTNTLQAALNVAQYPALTAGNVTNLYSGIPAITFYQPTLSAAPTDYSVAISYTGVQAPGTVGAVTLTSPGAGFTSVPAVTFSGGGSPTTSAAATATLDVTGYTNFVANTGTACTAPTATFSGGGALIQAVATVQQTSGTITGLTITSPGTGYTSVPTITFGPAKCLAQTPSATAVMGVQGVTVTNPGAGYTSAPTVTISGGTTAATATANEGTLPIGSPYVETLDANDDIYLGSQDVQAGNGSYSFYPSLQSNGATLYPGVQNATYNAPRGLAIDTLGHLWATENDSLAVIEMTPSTNAIVNTFVTNTAPWSIAIDKNNNIWYGQNQVFELAVATNYTLFQPPTAFKNVPRQIAIDANQNIWGSGYNSAGATGNINVYDNLGTVTSPIYAASPAAIYVATTGNNEVSMTLDSSGNAWEATSAGLFEATPTGTPITSIALSTGSPFVGGAFNLPNYTSTDGANTIWVANNGSVGQNIVQYVIGTNTANIFYPCYLTAGATTCAANGTQTYQHTIVDSTGAVWVTAIGSQRLYQILGPGAPAWPQLSYTAPGVMPQ